MNHHENNFKKVGVHIPEVLLPANEIDKKCWSVVACDQYTSQPEYWAAVAKQVEDTPSTLNLIYPEVFLEEEEGTARIASINEAMRQYLQKSILEDQGRCFVYMDRSTSHVASRKGLMLAVDLECYDYMKGSQTLIRATEGTVLERIPPRVRIRQDAALELPHIMLLIDDPEKTVIEPLADKAHAQEKLYDFELMMAGGHITGYKIQDEASFKAILDSLTKLAHPEHFKTKYQVSDDKGVLLFAVGDGNHSLATAKAHWENVKAGLSQETLLTHPARFALVEVVNVHDDGIVFEPIHRVVFHVDALTLLSGMVSHYGGSEYCFYEFYDSMELVFEGIKRHSFDEGCHLVPFVTDEKYGFVAIKKPSCNLAVGTLQNYLDALCEKDKSMKIDYIHGDDVVTSLGSKPENIGFFLPSMNKHDLFKTVILDGALPRKTFSMGEADEKRYYLECRKIVAD